MFRVYDGSSFLLLSPIQSLHCVESQIYSLELAAYHTAVQQWQEAQTLQDEEYLQGDYAVYLNATREFEIEYARWTNLSVDWDKQWEVYAADERHFYASYCPV